MSWKLPRSYPLPQPSPALLAWAAYGLSPRLAALAEAVPAGSIPVDVGTDHALLPEALVASGRCPAGIAIDVSPAPLRKARERMARSPAREALSLRCGDGLRPLSTGEADILLLAGVSGDTVAKVLLQPDSLTQLGLRRLVLQPNDKEPLVRQVVHHLGWKPLWETFVADGQRFFWTLCAERREGTEERAPETSPSLVEERFWTPSLALGDPLLPAWLLVKERWLSSVRGLPRPHPLYGADYVPRWRAQLDLLRERLPQRPTGPPRTFSKK